jgi:hypothetical protein
MVQREPCRVGLWVSADGEVEEEGRDIGVKIDRSEQAVGEILLGDVFARAREKAVVRKGIKEWAWTPNYLCFKPRREYVTTGRYLRTVTCLGLVPLFKGVNVRSRALRRRTGDRNGHCHQGKKRCRSHFDGWSSIKSSVHGNYSLEEESQD